MSMTSLNEVFSKSRSKAFWAESNTLSKVSRIQWPTGQSSLGFRAGEANDSGASTAR